MSNEPTFTAFAGDRLVASSDIKTTLRAVKSRMDAGESAPILVFDDRTGKTIDFDLRGTPDQVMERLDSHPLFALPGPGRAKPGLAKAEVSLMPRHWEWLEQQPQGVSGALRRLVEEAARREPEKERARLAREAAAQFMWVLAGNLPGFEEASRAVYAGDGEGLDRLISSWPADIQAHLRKLLG